MKSWSSEAGLLDVKSLLIIIVWVNAIARVSPFMYRPESELRFENVKA
jgi:hypothetical protein